MKNNVFLVEFHETRLGKSCFSFVYINVCICFPQKVFYLKNPLASSSLKYKNPKKLQNFSEHGLTFFDKN